MTIIQVNPRAARSPDWAAEAGAVSLGEFDIGLHSTRDVLAAEDGEGVTIAVEPVHDLK